MRTIRHRLVSGILGAVLLMPPSLALAQQPTAPSGIGVVTAIQGQATVARQAHPEPASLRFKDDVFFRDQITTKERSSIRLLLGGKGVLTVREQSQVTLDETVAADGGRRSVLGLLAGKIGAAIARTLMRPGEEVEVRTPNAVAAVRGTVLIAEYIPPKQSAQAPKPILLASSAPGPFLAQTQGAAGGQSNFFVLSGSVTITPLGQPPVIVGAMQSLQVTATPGGVQAGTVQTITPAQAAQVSQGLEMAKPHTGEAEGSANVQAQAQIAAAVASTIVQTLTGEPVTTSQTAAGVSSDTGCISCPPTPPPPAVNPETTENVLPSGPILTMSHAGIAFPNTPFATFNGGAVEPVLPLDLTGTGRGADYVPIVVTAPLLEVTGTTIIHAGSLITLNDFTLEGYTSTVPLVQISGTSLTNTGGPLFSLGGGSSLESYGPLLGLDTGASASLAGLIDATGASTVELGPADAVRIPTGTSLTATAPLFSLSGGSHLTTAGGGSLVWMDPSTLTLSAPILSMSSSSASLTGPVLRAIDSTVTGGASGGLVSLQDSTLGLQGGSLLDSQNSTLSFAAPMVALSARGAYSELISENPGTPLFRLSGGSLSLTGDGALLSVSGDAISEYWSNVSAGGPLLEMTGGTLNLGATGAAVRLNNASLSLSGATTSLVSENAGATVNISGTVLDSTNSTVTIGDPDAGGGPIFALRGGSRVNFTRGPMIRLNSSSLYAAGGFGDSDWSATQVTLGGTLIEATNSYIEFGPSEIPHAAESDSGVTTYSQPAGVPQFRLIGSTLNDYRVDSELVEFSNGTSPSTYNGLLLIAEGGSSIAVPNGNLLGVGNGHSVTTTEATSALFRIRDSAVTSGREMAALANGELDLAGPLISATNSDLTTGTSVLAVRNGSTLTYNSTLPIPPALMQFTDSTVNMNGHLLSVSSDAGQPGSKASLAGPLLNAVNSHFDTGPQSSFVYVTGGATFTSTTTLPLLTLDGGSVTTKTHLVKIGVDSKWSGTGSSATLVPDGSTDRVSATLDGQLLKGMNTTITATNSVASIRDWATFTSYTHAPLIELDGSTVALGGPDPDPNSPTHGQQVNGRVFDVSSTLPLPYARPASAEVWGPILSATNNTAISTTDRILGIFGVTGASATLTSHTTDPLVQLTGGSVTMSGTFYPPSTNTSGTTTDTSGSFLRMSSPESGNPATLLLAGPLLSATGTTFDGHNHFIRINQNAHVTSEGTGPLVQLSGGSLTMNGTEIFAPTSGSPTTTTFGDFARVQGTGASLSLAGPLLDSSGTAFTLGGAVLRVRDGASLTASTTAPLMQFSDSTIDSNGNVFNMGSGVGQPGSTLTLAGPLLNATNSFIETGPVSTFMSVYDGATLTSSTTDPLLILSGASISTKGHLVRFGLNNTWNSAANAWLPTDSQGVVSATLAGPLLRATNTEIGATYDIAELRDAAILRSTTTAPLIQLESSTVALGGPDPDPTSPTFGQPIGGRVFDISPILTTPSPASADLMGPVLAATNSYISTTDRVIGIFGGTGASARLTSHTADPLVQFTGGSVTMSGPIASTTSPSGTITTDTTGGFLRMSSPDPAAPAILTLAGPLLSATGTTFDGQDHFLKIRSNAQVTSTSPDALVQLAGVNLSINGTEVITPTTGSPTTSSFGDLTRVQGTGASLSLAGPLLIDSGSTINMGGRFLRVQDGATLTATTTDSTQALVQLTDSQVTNGGGFRLLSSSLGQPGSSATLQGPILTATRTPINISNMSLVDVRDGATFSSATPSPLVRLDSSPVSGTISASGIIFSRSYDGTRSEGPVNATIAGPLLVATDSSINLVYNLVNIGDATTFRSTDTTAPLVQVGGATGSPVTLGGIDLDPTSSSYNKLSYASVFGVGHRNGLPNAPTTVDIRSSILHATNSPIEVNGTVLGIWGGPSGGSSTVTNTWGTPLVDVSGGSLTMASTRSTTDTGGTITWTDGRFLQMSSPDPGALASLTTAGSLLHASNTIISAQNDFIALYGNARLTTTGLPPVPAVQLDNSQLTVYGTRTYTPAGSAPLTSTIGTFLTVSGNSIVSLDGPLLQATNSDVAVKGNAIVSVSGGGQITTTRPLPQPFISVSGGNFTIAPNANGLFMDNATVSINGPLFKADGTTLSIADGGYAGSFLSLNNGSTLDLNGPVLDLVNAPYDLTVSPQPVINLSGGSTFNHTAGPVVRVTGSPGTLAHFAADSVFSSVGAGNTVHSTGTLLQATDANVTLRTVGQGDFTGSTTSMSSTDTFIRLTNSNLAMTGPDPLVDSISGLGVGLIATNNSGTTRTINLASPLLRLWSANLATPDPYIQLSNMTVNQSAGRPLIEIHTDPGYIANSSVAGPLLAATGSSLSTAGSLLSVVNGVTLDATNTSPLLQLTGVNLDMWTALPLDTVLTLGAGKPIVEMSSSNLTPPPTTGVNLSSTGGLLKVDNGILAASGQIVNAINSVLNVNGDSADAGADFFPLKKGAVHFDNSIASNLAGGFQLNNSLLTVSNGPLLSLTNGARVTINGDFASLTGGSKIHVQNGPMIYVGGSNLGMAPPMLTVTGSLVNFASGTGNQVIINNSIPSTGTISGIPVSQAPGTTITIANPIKNPANGILTVCPGACSPGTRSTSSSVIQTYGGGIVNIQGH